MSDDRRPWRKMGLLAGDWLALALFVFLGQIDHDLLGTYGLSRLLTTTIQLALPWTIIAPIMGAYRLGPDARRRSFLGRSLNAWLVAAPIALLLRAWLQGRTTIVVDFFLVTLGLGGGFLLGWRVILLLWVSREQR